MVSQTFPEAAVVPAQSDLAAQLAFVREIDALKNVYRQTTIMDGSRRENSAEHSWHIALTALVLAEYADEPVETGKVVRLLLIHDIVEIDAGDTFAFDTVGKQSQAAREDAAAARLFGLLPERQAREMLALWAEFEARATPEARFAHAVDRLLPALHNFSTGGGTWRRHGVNHTRVVERMRPIAEYSAPLWAWLSALLDEAVRRGYLDAA